MYRRAAWLLAALTAVLVVCDTVLTTVSGNIWTEQNAAVHGWPVVPIASLGAALLGALIVSRRPRHAIGWLLCAVGTSASISLAAEAYATWALDAGGPAWGPSGHAAAW